MSDTLTLNVIFEDGILPLTVKKPEGLTSDESDVFCLGVAEGVSAYLQASNQGNSYHKEDAQPHKHLFRLKEGLPNSMTFECLGCPTVCTVGRLAWNYATMEETPGYLQYLKSILTQR